MSADDQASGLRTLARRRSAEARRAAPGSARVLCLAGGGSVTRLATALGLSLARRGHRVLLASGARLRELWAGSTRSTLPSLDDWARGAATDVREAVVEGPDGLRLLALGASLTSGRAFPEGVRARLLDGLRGLDGLADLVLLEVGTHLGQAESVVARCASEVLVATPADPHGMADAYALIKSVARIDPAARVGVVTAPCETLADGLSSAERLVEVATRFLAIRARVLGALPGDSRGGAPVAEVAGAADSIAETLTMSACRTRDPERGLRAAAARLGELWNDAARPRHRDGG